MINRIQNQRPAFSGFKADSKTFAYLYGKKYHVDTWKYLDILLASQQDNLVTDIFLKVVKDADNIERLSGKVVPTKKYQDLFEKLPLTETIEKDGYPIIDVLKHLVGSADWARGFARSVQKDSGEISDLKTYKMNLLEKSITIK